MREDNYERDDYLASIYCFPFSSFIYVDLGLIPINPRYLLVHETHTIGEDNFLVDFIIRNDGSYYALIAWDMKVPVPEPF